MPLITMLLYAIDNQDSVIGIIDFIGIVEPDKVVGGVHGGLLYGVIQTPRR